MPDVRDAYPNRPAKLTQIAISATLGAIMSPRHLAKGDIGSSMFFIGRNNLTTLIIWIVVLLVSITATQGHAQTLNMAIGDWSPYVVFDDNGKPSGIAVDKAHQIFGEMGLKLAIIQLPFKRAVAMAKAGEVDGMLMSADKFGRRGFLALSRPIFCDRRFLYVRKGHAFDWRESAGLKGKTLGVGLGFYNGEAVQRWIADRTVKTIEVANTLSLFKMVVHNRVNFIAFSQREADILLNQNPTIASDVERLDPPVSALELHLGFTLSRCGQYRSVLADNAIEHLGLEERCD